MKGARKAGIQNKSNFIMGMPGMTWGDVFRTYGFIFKLALIDVEDISAYPYSAYPGSELFNQLVEEGKIKLNHEYFENLSSYTDVGKGTAYNDILNTRALSVFCFITMAYFYALNLLFHPKRLLKFIYSILGVGSFSRFHMAVLQWKKRQRIKKLLISREDTTLHFR